MDLFPLAALTLVTWGALGSFFLLVGRHRQIGAVAALFFVFPAAGALAVVPSLVLGRLFPPGDYPGSQFLFIWTFNAPVEELFQYLLFALAAQLFQTLRRPSDGALQGAATGLGFGLVENWLYALQGGWSLVVLRTFISLPGHLAYGAAWGGFHSHEFYLRRPTRGRLWVPLAALIPAIFAHGTSNTLTLFGAPWEATLAIDGVFLAFGVFLFLQLRTSAGSGS